MFRKWLFRVDCSGFKTQRSSIVLAETDDKFAIASANAIAVALKVLLVRLGKFFKPCFLLFNVVAFVALFIVLHFFQAF